MHKSLENFPIAELEQRALKLRAAYTKASRQLSILLKRPDTATQNSIRASASLHDILIARKTLLNRAFVFNAATTVHLLAINQLFQTCLAAARRESRPVLRKLRQRIAAKDQFLYDYEFEIRLQHSTGKEGIHALLEEISNNSPAHLSRAETIVSRNRNAVDLERLNWNGHDGLHLGEPKAHHVGYAMHELHSHSLWSLPDILQITSVWTDIVFTHQRHSELSHFGNPQATKQTV